MPKRTSRRKKSPLFSIYKLSFMPWAICLIAVIFYAYDYLLRVQPSIMVHDLMHFFWYGCDWCWILIGFLLLRLHTTTNTRGPHR